MQLLCIARVDTVETGSTLFRMTHNSNWWIYGYRCPCLFIVLKKERRNKKSQSQAHWHRSYWTVTTLEVLVLIEQLPVYSQADN